MSNNVGSWVQGEKSDAFKIRRPSDFSVEGANYEPLESANYDPLIGS